MEREEMNMSRRELTALLGFTGAVAGGIYLGWLLFWHWPVNGAFGAHYESPASPLFMGFSAYAIAIAALQNWRRNEPQADERDLAIDGTAAKSGFYALALLNLVGGVAAQAKPELLLQFGAEWIRYCLLWMVLLALAVFGGCQLYRYRRG
jgi:hypothetical protein